MRKKHLKHDQTAGWSPQMVVRRKGSPPEKTLNAGLGTIVVCQLIHVHSPCHT